MAALPLDPLHVPRGMGTNQLLREVRPCPKQRSDTGGPLSCPLVRIKAAQGPFGTFSACWSGRQMACVPSCARCNKWGGAPAPLDKLCVLGPACANLESSGTHDRQALLKPLRCLHPALTGMVQATLRAEDKGRLRDWHVWLDDSSTSKEGAVYGG